MILLVEDEAAIADTIRFALERDGFEVRHVTLGADGIREVREASPELVVLDVGLPDRNGFDVCREIRRFSDVPIIFLTARDDEVDRIVGLEIGADDYVAKPFSPRELATRVRVILRRGRSSAAAAAAAEGELAIDAERRRVVLAGAPLDLTRYEFDLLALLASRPGRVWTRAQILEHVWPQPTGSGERTVDSHVRTLRRKLAGADPQREWIVTHRGVGYSLVTDSPAGVAE